MPSAPTKQEALILPLDLDWCYQLPPGCFPHPPPLVFDLPKELAKLHRAVSSNHFGGTPLLRILSWYQRPTATRPHNIQILDNDSLLNVFHLCRPALLDVDEADDDRILEGGEWVRERWWYKLVQVCRKWRYIILGSPSYLGLCLVCTYGTPIAFMLEHSPCLPLIIDHVDEDHDITVKDEEGIILALQHRDRVRRIRLQMSVPSLQRLIMSMDGEFPRLEYLYIAPPAKHHGSLTLPKTFYAPNLRHLILVNFDFPIGSPLITTAVGLVTLSLQNIHPSAYFSPNNLLQRLSHMPQLETLGITFHSPVPNRDVEMELLDAPIITRVTLPNLRWFGFKGASAYLEALLPGITTPLLEKLQILYFNQLTFSATYLLEFMRSIENFRFSSAKFEFYDGGVAVGVYPCEGAKMYAFYMHVGCRHLDWQVACVAQIFNALSPVFSAVEHLKLEYEEHSLSLKAHNEVDPTQWHKLLRSFNNVVTLRVSDGLVPELSRSLKLDDEKPLGLAPELKELECSAGGDTGNEFSSFIEDFRPPRSPDPSSNSHRSTVVM